MAMVVTSHFSHVIEEVADRAILLENGEIVEIGDPESVIKRFMENYSDIEQHRAAVVGEKILVARDVVKRISRSTVVWSGRSMGVSFRGLREGDLRDNRQERCGQDDPLPDHSRDP